MRFRDFRVVTEKWCFHCLHCLETWESQYEARHGDDGHGAEWVTWRLGGMVSPPPWSDPTCPNCQGLHVKVLPAGTLTRRRH